MNISFGTFGFEELDEMASVRVLIGKSVVESGKIRIIGAIPYLKQKVKIASMTTEPVMVECVLENGDKLLFKNNAYLKFEGGE